MTPFDETFDFVVVGSGGGSMCCALALRAGGASARGCVRLKGLRPRAEGEGVASGQE